MTKTAQTRVAMVANTGAAFGLSFGGSVLGGSVLAYGPLRAA